MTHQALIWGLFGFCLVLSFLLSGMEAGVFALSRLRIRQQMREGRHSAKVLHDFLEHPENFLWTILVGNTVANLFILGWLVIVLSGWFGAQRLWFVAVYVLLVFLFYTLFDLLPKMLFRMFPTRLCIIMVRPFSLVHFLLRPLVKLVESCSDLLLRWRGGKAFTGRLFGNREELRSLMQESTQTLTSEERTMINRVLDLQNLTVRQVMAPIEQVVTLEAQAAAQKVLDLCRERNLTRLPVWELREGKRRTIGLVTLDALLYHPELNPAAPVLQHLQPALFLEEDLRLEVALRRMQRGGHRLAMVLGRDGREIGVLSLQDVLKVIFGDVSL
jgi:CBS domain containing-hemolysin-like protein